MIEPSDSCAVVTELGANSDEVTALGASWILVTEAGAKRLEVIDPLAICEAVTLPFTRRLPESLAVAGFSPSANNADQSYPSSRRLFPASMANTAGKML